VAEVARLMVPEGEGKVARVLEQFPFKIGRLPENHLVIAEGDVSREHAEIAQEGNAYVLRDKGSKFGTYVNEKKLEGPHKLAHGDHVHFGSPHRPPVEFQLVTDEITSRFTIGTMQALPEDAKTRRGVSGRSMNPLGQALQAMAQGPVLAGVGGYLPRHMKV